MAITRRQFVTRLGALAAAAGLSQSDMTRLVEAWAHDGVLWGSAKPKIVWVHGAECTGCSTSVLGIFEDVTGRAVEDTRLTAAVDGDGGGITTADALGLITSNLAGTALDDPHGHLTLTEYLATASTAGAAHYDNAANDIGIDGAAGIVNIADVLIDFLDLQYHETVMGMAGDQAYQYLEKMIEDSSAFDEEAAEDSPYFVLVVEGAVQDFAGGGYWGKTGSSGDAAWCAIGMDDTGTSEHSFDDVVKYLAGHGKCVAVLALGQCATFGGYPACVSPVLGSKQTPAYGVHDFLANVANNTTAANKVVNVPGCPTNPWWFVLTVVLYLAEIINGPLSTNPPFQVAGPLGILNANTTIKGGVDSHRRLTAVYGQSVHGPACPRYKNSMAGPDYLKAQKPGDPGCLMDIGCKGLSTGSLCSLHGWNGQQPWNDKAGDWTSTEADIARINGSKSGGFCVTGGHPCMGCTERGYPDSYVPFITKR